MPRLNITPFAEALLPLVSNFECGPHKYEREVAEWIRGEQPRTVLDAIRSRSRPTLVWLYSTADAVVGYGSLCRSAWSSIPGGRRDMPIMLIPNLGIHVDFQGCPKDAAPDDRYSSQIIEHLIHEARRFPFGGCLPLLGLFLHPDNTRARRCYERKGFRDFPQTSTDEDGDVYQGMILKLAPADADDMTREDTMLSQQPAPETSAPDADTTTQHTFEQAVSAVLNAPPTPEQQAKKAARKARAEERKRKKPKRGR